MKILGQEMYEQEEVWTTLKIVKILVNEYVLANNRNCQNYKRTNKENSCSIKGGYLGLEIIS